MEEELKYQRRSPEQTVLYQTIRDYLDDFLNETKAKGRTLPDYIEREFRAYLKCGQIQFGFLRRECEDCGKEEFTPFSCKKRGFCPSCCGRKMAETAVHLMDNVLPDKAMRQWVVTLPFPLRYIASTDKEIQTKMHEIIINKIHGYYKSKAEKKLTKDPKAGSITFIQRWGTALNLNLHWHVLALDGVFFLNSNDELSFLNIKEPTNKEFNVVLKSIKDKIFRYLRKKNIIKGEPEYLDLPSGGLFEESGSDALSHSQKASVAGRIAFGERAGQKVRFIGKGWGYEEETTLFTGKLCGSMNGFSLHCKTRIKAFDRKGRENLIMYMARGPIASHRLSRADDGSDNLLYKLKTPFSDGRTHVLLSPIELIEKISALIPPPRFNQTRYNGVFAPGCDWRKEVVKKTKKTEEESTPEDELPAPYRYPWAFLLKRVFGIDGEKCPECGGRLKYINTIEDPDTISKILGHVGISTDPPHVPQRERFSEKLLYEEIVDDL